MIRKILILLLVIPLTMFTHCDKQGLAMKDNGKLKIEDNNELSNEVEIRPIELLEPILDPTIEPIELLEPILDPNIKPAELLEPELSEGTKADEIEEEIE